MQYGVAAVVGAVMWGALGVTFGDVLFGYVFSFEDHTPSHFLLDSAWAILVMPAILFDNPSREPLGLVGMTFFYACNGVAWGTAITFVAKTGFIAWRRVRIRLRRSRRRTNKQPISV